MLRSFPPRLEKHVLTGGAPGLALGVLAFGSVLAALFGGPVTKAVAVVVAVVLMAALFATFVARRHHERAERARDRRLVARYCDVLQRTRGAPLHIKMWDDVTVIDTRGGAVETVKVIAEVRDQDTHFFRFRIGSAWDQPESHRSEVVCVVRNSGGGPKYETTKTWLADGRLEVLAHLPAPAVVGADLRIMLTLTWPGMCEPLVRDRLPDDYTLRFARAVALVRYVIVLPEGENASVERIGFDREEKGYQVKAAPNAAGRTEVSLIAHDVPAKRRFGLRLGLE